AVIEVDTNVEKLVLTLSRFAHHGNVPPKELNLYPRHGFNGSPRFVIFGQQVRAQAAPRNRHFEARLKIFLIRSPTALTSRAGRVCARRGRASPLGGGLPAHERPPDSNHRSADP